MTKTFLVTGATGFIGGALARNLLESGGRVVAICRDGDPPKGCAVIRGDIEDIRTCERAMVEEQPDGVFHLAAQPIVGFARQDPFGTMETNVRGTYSMLEAYRRHRIAGARMVVASSDKAYGELPKGKRAYTEDMPLAGRGPYDVSKSCTDLMAQSYGISYSLPIAIIRAGNVYGPGDDDMTRIIPGLCSDVINRRQLTVTSDGTPVREYLHVDDVVRGYVSAYELHRTSTARAFNLGTGEPLSVLELVQEFQAMLLNVKRRQYYNTWRELAYHVDQYLEIPAIKEKPVQIFGTRVGEIQTQVLDASRANKELLWNPSRGLQDGLHETLMATWELR